MAQILPFKALRPRQDKAAEIASPPYDVINVNEAKDITMLNPYSFLRVTRAEVDLPDGVDVHSYQVYEQAALNLESFISNGYLLFEDKPCYYIYRLIMNGKSQTGLVALSSVKDYKEDVIKKHEFTRPEKEQDRIDHMTAIKAQTGNVFMAYKNVAALDEIIKNWQLQHEAEYDFTAADGIEHTIWVVNDDAVIEAITHIFDTDVPATYIADGHHRAASAAKVSGVFPGNDAAAYFLTTLFPENELAILDYNRVVKDLNGLTPEQLLQNLETDFTVTAADSAVKPGQPHQYGMYLQGKWYTLQAKEGTYKTDPVGILDVTVLADNVLEKWLGIADQRTDKRIDFVGGIRGLAELEKRVNSGEMAVAFSLYPVTIRQLFDIADSGNVMPPKSTWFEPKLRDGLLTHVFGGE